VLTRQRNPEGQLNIHNSTVMTIPTLGWGTSTWGGEQLDTHKPGVATLDILPMDAFRTEFTGRQWGVPSELLVYENRPYKSEDMLAYSILHGVLIRPGLGAALDRISALWALDDEFDLDTAEFHPYWSNSDILTCGPDGVYATAYHRPGEGLMIFVSNLGDEPVDATVRIKPAGLGWEGKQLSASDGLTHGNIPIIDGAITFELKSWRYRAVKVTAGNRE